MMESMMGMHLLGVIALVLVIVVLVLLAAVLVKKLSSKP